MENSNAKIRNSNLELLRIISMLGIVMIHYFRHGITIDSTIITMNRMSYELFSFTGRFGVICFVMITGYFMIESKVKFRSLLKLILEVMFFSVSITIISMMLGITEFSIKTIIKSFLPITFKQYWFMSVYVALYILIPFINILIHNLSKKQHILLIIILLLIFSVIPTFTLQRWATTTEFYQELGLFITIYIIAAYIRLYPNKYFNSIKSNVIIAILMQLIIWASIISLLILGEQNIQYFTDFNSTFVMMQSISIFLIFKNLNIKNNKIINSISTSTLAVYLIHEHPRIFSVLWKEVFKSTIYYNNTTIMFIVNIIMSITCVFIVSIMIDKIRIILIEKNVLKIYDNNIEKIKNKIMKHINKASFKNI